jgi:CRP-like cAMP-binding protein
VARRLAEICDRLPETAGRRTLHITQEDLAALAGTTRPTANKVLRELERAGTLALRRGRIEVIDLDRLAARAR